MKRFLPIGSVVMLNNSTKRLMIIGVKQVQEDGTEWDYSGCLFPEGLISSKEIFIFDEDQIDTLFFIGLQDDESLNYMQALSEISNEEDAAAQTTQPVVQQAPRPVAPPPPQPFAQQAPRPVAPPPQQRPTGSAAASSPGGGFCENCAHPIPPNAKFCKKCGARQ